MPSGQAQDGPRLDLGKEVETIQWYESIGSRRPVAALIDEVITFSSRKFGGNLSRGYWFRGVTSDSYSLVPKVHRHHTSKQECEAALLFRQRAPMRHQACPTLGDYAGWLCLMQHHGAPTRLLDWTGSLLVAAYFAVRKRMLGASLDDCVHGSGGAMIWALDAPLMNHAMLRELPSDRRDMPLFVLNQESVDEKPEINVLAPLIYPVFNKEAQAKAVRALAVVPAEANLRMLVQNSVFTIHRDPEPLERAPHSGNYLVRIPIPTEVIDELAKDLMYLGPVEATLFPDLDHLAEYWLKTSAWMSQVAGRTQQASAGT